MEQRMLKKMNLTLRNKKFTAPIIYNKIKLIKNFCKIL